MPLILINILTTAFRSLLSFVSSPTNVLIAGVLWVIAFGWGYWDGDAHRNEVWKAKIRAERQAQEKIVDDAKDRAIAEVVRLNRQVETQNAVIDQLQADAEKDVNAGRIAIGVDGVRRVYRIGPGRPAR